MQRIYFEAKNKMKMDQIKNILQFICTRLIIMPFNDLTIFIKLKF